MGANCICHKCDFLTSYHRIGYTVKIFVSVEGVCICFVSVDFGGTVTRTNAIISRVFGFVYR